MRILSMLFLALTFFVVTRNGDKLPLTVGDVKAAGTEVRVTLAPDSAKSFAAFTAAHRGEHADIVVDGKVEASPLIRGAITEGKVKITLRSADAAAELARALTQK